METDTVSIVIPIFNVKDYLEPCLQSILKQTYKNLEIILVNDGSTDGSELICCQYATMDKRVQFITQKNSGVSTARNRGIENAHGKYITFVDGDDWLDPRYIAHLVALIKENHTDASAVSMYEWFSKEKSVCKRINYGRKQVLERLNILNCTFSPKNPWVGFAVCKMYKTDIIKKHHLKYDPTVVLCEDSLFNCQYFSHVNSCAIDDIPLYFYRIRKTSATRKGLYHIPSIASKLYAIKKIKQIALQYPGTEFEHRTILNKYRTFLWFLCLKIQQGQLIKKKEISYLNSYAKKYSNHLTKNDKIKYILFHIHPKLLYHILNRRIKSSTAQ